MSGKRTCIHGRTERQVCRKCDDMDRAALHPVSDATPDLAAAAQAVVEAWDAPSTSIYEHHASVAIAIAALRDATPEGIDVEALGRFLHGSICSRNAAHFPDDDISRCYALAREYARQREGERP